MLFYIYFYVRRSIYSSIVAHDTPDSTGQTALTGPRLRWEGIRESYPYISSSLYYYYYYHLSFVYLFFLHFYLYLFSILCAIYS